MSATGLEAFDTTIEKTNRWLQDIMGELGTDNRRHAYDALRAALHALRDRLPLPESVYFAAQLPMLVRGFYYEGWHPTVTGNKYDREHFLSDIRHRLGPLDLDAENVARVVYHVIAKHIDAGEFEKIGSLLPSKLRDLWVEPAVVHH